MKFWKAYRYMPEYFAIPLAVLASGIGALALAAVTVYVLTLVLERIHGPDGPGAGVLLLPIAFNLAISTFIVLVSILIHLHHKTSWLTPTLAFATCVVLTRMMGPFDIQFAPFMLGTGAVTCIIICWLLRTKGVSSPEHV